MQSPLVKAAKFRWKKAQDLDNHVGQLETCWISNDFQRQLVDVVKEEKFFITFMEKTMTRFIQYGL